MLASLAVLLLIAGPWLCAAQGVAVGYPGRVLETGLHTLGSRTFHVQVPRHSQASKLPVVIMLGDEHSNGVHELPSAVQRILVIPSGLYQSDNATIQPGKLNLIVGEQSAARSETQSDSEFISDLIDHLVEYPNVNGDFSIYGKHRGAELGFQRDQHAANRAQCPHLCHRLCPLLPQHR